MTEEQNKQNKWVYSFDCHTCDVPFGSLDPDIECKGCKNRIIDKEVSSEHFNKVTKW